MRAFGLLLLIALPACLSASEGPDPDDAPVTMTLGAAQVDLLELSFEVSDTGYNLVATRRTLGAPTMAIVQDRDVLVTARDEDGDVLQTVSVDNPRLVTTAGSTKPGTAVLPRATLTVRLARPDEIRSIEVLVRAGPNEKMSRSFPIKPADTQPR